MIIFKRPADIRSFLGSKKKENVTTGFVPTMGALHDGHMALIKKAKDETAFVVSSIFVNPTQFNNVRDFEKYPSTIERDVCRLEKEGCDLLFLPSVADIYPDGLQSSMHYDLGPLETSLEGKFRPGHFQGVCQVVNRLLDIVKPGKLYLGQKDFQQCLVLTKMIELLGMEVQIVISKTHREADGLAMSSRNLRLDDRERKQAPAIYNALQYIKQNIKAGDTAQLTNTAKEQLAGQGFKVDYIEIAKVATLEIIQNWDGRTPVVALAAAYLNEIRLIDNMLMTAPE